MKNQREREFINAFIRLCAQHGFSLAHEDSQGSFIIEKYNAENIKRIVEALDYKEIK